MIPRTAIEAASREAYGVDLGQMRSVFPSPWVKRSEAAAYLRCSTSTISRMAIAWQAEPVPGKLREKVISLNGGQSVRVWSDDVLAILSMPEKI